MRVADPSAPEIAGLLFASSGKRRRKADEAYNPRRVKFVRTPRVRLRASPSIATRPEGL